MISPKAMSFRPFSIRKALKTIVNNNSNNENLCVAKYPQATAPPTTATGVNILWT
jgi:hypothetical protein